VSAHGGSGDWRVYSPIMGLICRILLAAVWLYAGLIKLFEAGGASLGTCCRRPR
jgi:uncharacterized membrane protein YphA (DoxX/SURF4 family)